MPVTVSTIPKKSTKSVKKQEDASRVYKNNLNGPGPNAPQPPSPESDATDDNDDAPSPPVPAIESATTPSKKTDSSSKKSKKITNLAQRLEVNQLLSELYPSKHITQKVAALEALSALDSAAILPSEVPTTRTRTRKTTSTTTPITNTTMTMTTSLPPTEDPVAKAIIDNAFNTPIPCDNFTTPPSSPPNAMNTNTLINAPKKSTRKQHAAPTATTKDTNTKGKKQKQNFNIIIHVEPKPDASRANSSNDISKRLDFGNSVVSPSDAAATKTMSTSKSTKSKVNTPVVDLEDDDDSDEDYIPGLSESEDGSWNTYEDDDESDDYYDEDDSYYSSSSSDSEDDDCNTEELEELQQKHMAEMKMLQSLRATYEDLLAKDKSNRIVAKQLKTLKESEEKIKQELDELTHRQKRKNSKKFRKLLRKKSSANDLEYFKKHLTINEQRAMIDEMNAVAKVTEIEKPYKLTLLESDIPRDMKAVAIRKVGMLQYMEPGCGEYCKLKNWVDAFMQIPFNKNKNLPITITDGVDCCHKFMTAAKDRLDTAVYGLNDAKMQIMQMVGQWIANPSAIGTAVAIHGPPGTGKTSLVKEGISKILGRDFAFIALGGATDSSFLEGHSYTYEGSMWGKIVDILIRCKSSNPVIYFDELDKISETSKGEEIVGILTHLTDTSQNSQFHDKYFSEVAFDLSKCLFIFSYNDESRVNPVLLDRMYKIRTSGYGTKEKTYIAQHHLIPRIRTEVAFVEGDIIIPDSVVEHIVEHHTHKEAGVRNLKRCLETIYTKLNLYRLMRPGTQLFDEKERSLEVSFPYTVTCDVVDKLIKKNESDRPNLNLYL